MFLLEKVKNRFIASKMLKIVLLFCQIKKQLPLNRQLLFTKGIFFWLILKSAHSIEIRPAFKSSYIGSCSFAVLTN